MTLATVQKAKTGAFAGSLKGCKKTFLVFSDLHITPTSYDTKVLSEIRDTIAKGRPDYIICTGDLGEFASQNRLVKDRGSFNVAEELTAVVGLFYHYIVKVVEDIQIKQRHDKKKLYKPSICVCLGNHDAPVAKELTKLLTGIGVHVTQHKIPLEIYGINFCHTFDKGVSGTACSSTQEILQTTMARTISGHTHVRSITEARTAEGYKQFAIRLPCATMSYPEWTPQGSTKWDRGYLWLSIDPCTDWYQYCFKELSAIT